MENEIISQEEFQTIKSSKLIVVVDDEQDIVELVSIHLKKSGFKVKTFNDAETMFSFIRTKTPDLVILDLALPKIDGWEVLRIIRQDLKLLDLKVIIFSALNKKEDIAKGEQFGIIRYYTKTEKTPSEMAIEIKNILK